MNSQQQAHSVNREFRLLDPGSPRGDKSLSPWYLGLPGPVYAWCEGTFEQSVRLGTRGDWSFSQNLDFLTVVTNGLEALYSKKLIHCDLRPANIMFYADPRKVDDYRLIDYASFGENPTLEAVKIEGQRDERDQNCAWGRGPGRPGSRRSMLQNDGLDANLKIVTPC